MNKEDIQKGEIIMDAYAIKPKKPFIAKTKLARTPASASHKKMVEFMDSHDFSVHVDKETKKIKCTVVKR